MKPAMRKRLEAQGFTGLDEGHLSDLAPWVRVVSATFTGWIAVGTLLESPLVLFACAPLAFLGVVLPWHPLDSIYQHGFRRMIDSPAMPPTSSQRRWAYAIVTVWLLAAGFAFARDARIVGWILGGALAIAEAVHATTLFCVLSYCFSWARRLPTSTSDR